MSATNVFENGLLSLIFENADYANVGDATGLRGSSTAGSFYISLHTATPDETGNQNTNEATFGSYDRVAVARSSAQWTVTSGTADNDNVITFPEAASGSNTITHFGIGSGSSGAGNLFLYGALGASRVISTGITASFAAGTLDVSLA